MAESGGSQGSDLTFSANLQDNVSPTADQIEKRLKALGASKHEIKMFLTAYDQATPKIKAAQDQLNKLPKDQIINIQANTKQLDDARSKVQKLKDLAKAPITFTLKAEHDIGDQFEKLRQKIPQMEMSLRNSLRNMPLTAGLLGATGAAYNVVSSPLSTMTGLPFSSLGLGVAGLGIAGAGAALAGQSFQQNSQLEQQMAQLTQILRTPAAAQQAYGQVVQTSQTTPFNQPDVLQSYIRMAQMGTNPANKAYGIKAAANLAAGSQVPISQATGALQSASQGYFTELNTLTGRNIRQSDFTYGGRYSGETYQQATSQVLKQYQNASQTQMQTFKGLMTNIQDIITQNITRPVGQPIFGAAKGMEQHLASTLQQPQTQLALSREVDKIQVGLVKVFQLVQQGSSYFKNSLEAPLKSITSSVVKLGSAFGQAFGGAVLVGVKYLSGALVTIVQPLTTIASTLGSIKVPILGASITEVLGVTKALHMFGISTSLGLGNIFKGLGTLNPLRVIEGFKQLSSTLAKVGLFEIVKSFLDMKNANDQLAHSFQGLGSKGQDSLDQLKVSFDELIFRANQLGKSVAQLKAYGAVAAEGVGANTRADPKGTRLAQVARFGALDIAKLSSSTGIGGMEAANTLQTWEKQLGAAHQIYGQGKSPQSVMDDISKRIYTAGEQLSRTLGISLPDAVKEATVALTLFKSQLTSAHIAGPRGASAASAIYQELSMPGVITSHDVKTFQSSSALTITRNLLAAAVAPSTDVLRHALKSGLDKSFTFTTGTPNLHGANTADIVKTLHQYANVTTSSQAADASIQKQIGPLGRTLDVHLPRFQNVLPQLGVSTQPGQVKGMDTTQSVQEILKLDAAVSKVQNNLASTNAAITKNQDSLQKWSIIVEQASAALAKFDLHGIVMGRTVEHLQNSIDRWQLSLQQTQTNALDPLQRHIAALSQQMADYQQNTMLPIQRSQEDWNQTMLMTSNHLEDVSNSLRVAQFNMSKFHDGMLVGENALNAQIESLTLYNAQLDMLRLQNMGLQADISRTQFHQGFTSTVQPLMGFDLSREITLGQQRQQMMQDKQAITYGARHYQLDLAARTQFQKEEIPFGQRLRGTLQAAHVESVGNISSFQLQNLQYQQQLKSRLLEEAMYAATIKERPLQDEQYRLNRKAFELQQSISIRSDRIARATEAIAKAQMPLQHALTHIQTVASIKQAALDFKGFELNEKLGKLQNVVADLRGMFGDYSKNLNASIKAGPDSILGHLGHIARDMGASHSILQHIYAAMHGGGSGGTGGFPTPGGGPHGPGFVKGAWDMLTGLLNPLTWAQTAYDGVKNGIGALGGLFGGGLAGTLMGSGVFATIMLGALNAAHIATVRATGAAGARRAGHIDSKFLVGPNDSPETIAAKEAALENLRGPTALRKGILTGEHKLGGFLSDLREGAPWKALMHPTFYARTQLPETAVRAIVFATMSAIGHPIAGVGAAGVAGELTGKRTGELAFNEAGHYRQFVITKGLFGFITRPIETIKDWTKGAGTQLAKDMNRGANAAEAATAAAKVVSDGEGRRFTVLKPGVVAVMDGIKAGLGGNAAAIGINDAKGFAVRAAQNLASTIQEGFGNVQSLATDPAARDAFSAKLALAQQTYATALADATAADAGTVKTFGGIVNKLKGESAQAQEAARRGQLSFFDKQGKAAADLSKVQDAAAHTQLRLFEEEGSHISKLGSFISKFGDHIGALGKGIGRFTGATVAFELLPESFKKAISHFTDTVTGAFSRAIGKFGTLIGETFTKAIGKFGDAIDALRTGLSHLPGMGGIAPETSAAAKAAREASGIAGGLEDSTSAEVSKLNALMKNHPQLQQILDNAKANGARTVEIGGKVFSVVTKALGVLSFAPAVVSAFQGKPAQAAAQAAKAGQYFIPGYGQALLGTQILQAIFGGPSGPGTAQIPIAGIKMHVPGLNIAGLNVPGLGGGGGPYSSATVGPQQQGLFETVSGSSGGRLNIAGGPAGGVTGLLQTKKQAVEITKQYAALTLQQQSKLDNDSFAQQQAAYAAALTGPNGLSNYLGTTNNLMAKGYQVIQQTIQAAQKMEGSLIQDHLNAIIGGHAEMWTGIAGTTSNGYQAIGTMSATYLSALTKQIDHWAKANGLPLSSGQGGQMAGSAAGAAFGSGLVNAISNAVNVGNSVSISKASGGLVDADAHKVGPGRIIRMVEEGHPEVVIPLAPHRRDRAKSLIAETKGLLGYASGGQIHALSHDNAVKAPALTQDQLNAKFGPAYDSVWSRLQGLGAIPPGITKPAYTIVPTDSTAAYYGEASGQKGVGVNYTDRFVRQFLTPKARLHGYAQDEQIHEMAHVFQNAATYNTTWMREGGAQAWSDEWATKLYGRNSNFRQYDGAYGSYVSQVKKQLGLSWINSGQFDNPALGVMAAGGTVGATSKLNRAGQIIKYGDMLDRATGGYVWPYGPGISSGRIDEGWDMAGSGQIAAIGNTGPLMQGQAGWPGTGEGFYYQLLDGIRKGQYVYVYENIKRLKALGSRAKAGEVLANLLPAYPHLESGWSTSSGAPTSQGRYTEGVPEPEGYDFQKFLTGLTHGKLIGGGTSGVLGGTSVSPIHLHKPPHGLDKFGVVGPKQHAILQHHLKKWQKHLDSKSTGTGTGGSALIGTGGISPGSWMQVATQIAKKHHWGPSEIAAWRDLESREDGSLSLTASNSSGAYGLAQFINGPSEYAQYGGNSTTLVGQLTAMANYIAGRYGAPSGAISGYVNRFGPGNSGYAGGMPNVPRDNFPAMLHKDERVLTAAENNLYKNPGGMNKAELEAIKDAIEKSNIKQEIKALHKAIENHASLHKIGNLMQAVKDSLGAIQDVEQKMLLQAIDAQIKASGPHATNLAHLLGTEIAKSGKKGLGGEGPAGTQTSNLVNNLIDKLHNLPNAKGKGVHSLEADIVKLGQTRLGIASAKKLVVTPHELAAAKHALAKDKADGASKAKLKAAEHLVKTDEAGTLAAAKKVLAHDQSTHASKKKIDAAEKLVDTRQAALKHINKGNESARKQQAAIAKEEAVFTKKELALGVSKSAIEYAIKHVGDKDNQGTFSDKQLQGIPSATLKHATGTKHPIGIYTPPHQTAAQKKAAEAAQKAHHGGATSPSMKGSIDQAKKQTETAKHQLDSAKKSEVINKAHLDTAKKAADTVKIHLATAKVHLNTAQDHLKTASDAAGAAKDHSSKSESAATVAQKARDTQAKTFDSKTDIDTKHQATIEKQFSAMVTHLNAIATKVEKLNPTVQNNITVQVDGKTQATTQQKTKAPKNR